MAVVEMSEPQVFTRAYLETFQQGTPRHPYLTFKLGPRGLQRLVVNIWSHDQGWCDEHLKTQDPFANSQTWFSFGLVDEATTENEAHHDLYEFQRNIRASRDIRCYTNEWNIGIPVEEKNSSNMVHGWIESLAEVEGSTIGVFPLAQHPGWVNSVWKMEVRVYPRTLHGDQLVEPVRLVSLEEELSITRSTVPTTPGGHPDRAGRLNNLGVQLGNRYSRTGAMADLEEAIYTTRQAVEATPENHPDFAGRLNNLGVQLGNRYLRTGAMEDLEEAVQTAQQVVEATPENHPDRAGVLNNLGVRLGNRYSRTGAMEDLEEAIKILRQAVKATPENHPDRTRWLNNLGGQLGNRYLRTGAMEDLGEAIQISRQVVEATPENHPDRAGVLNNLGNRLGNRHLRTGAIEDLEEATQTARQAVEATSENHPDRAGVLNNLGVRLGNRYSRTGAMEDLEEAIEILRQAVKATPEDHPDRAKVLNDLGGRLGDRYSRTGAMENLEEAIYTTRQAVEATPKNHPDLAERLNNLGVQLGNRYSRIGAMEDLEEAIQISRHAVKATPEDHPDRARQLNTLGNRFGNRYSRTGAMEDLGEAVQTARQVVEATPENHPDFAGRLNNLGVRLGDRYSRIGAIEDLEEAIEILRQAVKATPEDHPDRATLLNTLGNRFGNRYLRTGAIEDLGKAIQTARQAVEATPENHPNRAAALNNLGVQLGNRHSRIGAIEDLDESLQLSLTALNLRVSPPSHRITVSRKLLSSPRIFQTIQNACEIAETAVSLVRLLAPQSLQNTDKEHLLSQAAGLGSDAAAIMLQARKGPFAAIQMLETSCGVLMGSLYDLRADVSALKGSYPELSRTFISLRDKLDAPASRSSVKATIGDSISATQREGNQRREADDQLKIVVQKIRGLPGFERFLLPPSEDEVCQAAANGPIVVVNISPHRCDALIVEASGIRTLELPQLSRQDLENKEPQSLDTLVWLWDTIISPVLTELGLAQAVADSEPPHIWWIPIGPLVRFPLHAAGNHFSDHPDTALDRVVSSYSSSIRAIIHGRQQRVASPTDQDEQKIALVAMENTPGVGRLDFAREEIDKVRAFCESMRMKAIEPGLRKDEVLSALETCWIFHFAGHGSTHPANPLQSQLLLDDWEKDPLTVASLLETNLGSGSPFLAYLSACGTGQIKTKELIDEGIHLTAAYQLAGFRHVIGTLWSVDDRLCVDMARMVYEVIQNEALLNNGMSDEAVSRGLHHAMRELRDQWVKDKIAARSKESRDLRPERDAQLDENIERGLPYWVPYVHFGV
ncbi:hypothetical protein PG990_001633 [Apiospora arundinis]|uniref:CHAT domain-containing protein n=1 Tax=Apiospora arundinis TaxID=335852 RepID=A0ABR2HRT6_9PEZI